MLSVYPILISIVRDNNLVNEVRRSCDQRLWQLMTISGWNCQWCSNKVNITVTHTTGTRMILAAFSEPILTLYDCMCKANVPNHNDQKKNYVRFFALRNKHHSASQVHKSSHVE